MKHAPLFLALTLLAPPALAESLDAAWAAALAANPALQASEANTQASRHLVNSAKANRWPTLSAGAVWARHQPMPKVQTDLTGLTSGLAGLLPPMALARLPGSVAQPVADDKGWSANATVSLPVFTSGKITAGIRAAEAGVEAAEASESRARQDLKLAARRTTVNNTSSRHNTSAFCAPRLAQSPGLVRRSACTAGDRLASSRRDWRCARFRHG